MRSHKSLLMEYVFVSDQIELIQATAKQTQERHSRPRLPAEPRPHTLDRLCRECSRNWPCPDFVAAGVVLDAATQLAEREVEHASLVAFMERRMTLIPEYEERLHEQANTIRKYQQGES